ncbi:hypothetical protein BGZ94_007302 [Podila epigama]|nr:hypothetical protein BGZ94_007302 [Podila epigama]
MLDAIPHGIGLENLARISMTPANMPISTEEAVCSKLLGHNYRQRPHRHHHSHSDDMRRPKHDYPIASDNDRHPSHRTHSKHDEQTHGFILESKQQSYFPSAMLPADNVVRASMDRERVARPPANPSDLSEAPLETFAEGESIESQLHRQRNEPWDSQSHHSSSSSSSRQLRQARARCSSSTLFDDARPPSELKGHWSTRVYTHEQHQNSPYHLQNHKHFPSDSHPSPPTSHHQYYRGTFDPSTVAAVKKQSIHFQDAYPSPQRMDSSDYRSSSPPHSRYQQFQQAHQQPSPKDSLLKQHQVSGDTGSMNSYGGDSPNWSVHTRLKIEPATPVAVRPPLSTASSSNNLANATKVSSPLSAPTTPLTPLPADLDKPTKNLMLFNKIPRQWPSSQETLHHNYVATPNKKPVGIKELDPVTAERIDRVINKESAMNRAAKERLAAEQKEAELEARGFFNPAQRWKGRDVYPRPPNWVYCRRTKNNWLEKTKILVDSYKLFKGQILGKGHHADVYKGIDLHTGQDLAIKVVYKTVNRRLGFINEDPMQEVKNRRLLNEAWFIDYLKDGPGICKMLRVVETSTKFYFVMELAQSDLNSYSNGINMREEEIRHILKPIFECLKYAHSHDITHRDIKPENILLRTRKDWVRNAGFKNNSGHGSQMANRHLGTTPGAGLRRIDSGSSILSSNYLDADNATITMGTDGRSSMEDESGSSAATLYNFDHRFDAFLADWGLAVEHDCESGRKPVGTPLYAAPEVVRKMKRIRKHDWINYRACDIWSLGVTMFVVASGIYPYHTHDALEAQSPPNWAALESSGMSREYIAFTQRLMNLTAELRPSAEEACNDPWLQG